MLTLAQAVAAKGDPKKLIANLRRRLRHQPDPHSHYTFGQKTASKYEMRWNNELVMNIAKLEVAAETNDTERYIAAWCQLNHLKH